MEANPESIQDAADSGPSKEKTLKTFHPAMFANHPISYLGHWLVMIAGVIGFFASLAGGNAPIAIVSIIAFLLALASYGYWTLKVMYQVLTITEKRTLYRQGILTKRTNEVQHDDVRNIQMDQSFVQRLLKVGNIAISSSGQDDMEIVVKGVTNPQEIVDIIRRYQ